MYSPRQFSSLFVRRIGHRANKCIAFRDKRVPHEVQFALERTITIRTLFTRAMEDGTLCLRAKAIDVAAGYNFILRFEAALPVWNCCSLRMEVSWGELSSDNFVYYRKTSGSWFESCTSDLIPANRPLANEGSVERYCVNPRDRPQGSEMRFVIAYRLPLM